MKISLILLIFFYAFPILSLADQAPLTTENNLPAADDNSVADPDPETLESFFYLYQPYINNISAYEPIYFLVGTNPSKSKFQFSFKYRLFNPQGPLVTKHPWVNGFHFGYTQTSFWNLESDSQPFEDTSYKPELFHLTTNIRSRPDWMQGLFWISGVQHESNGRAESFSRSTNQFYVRPVCIFYSKKSKLGLGISPKVWVYFKNSDENSDIDNYRGYFELEAKVGKADSFVLGSKLRWAREGGSLEVDLTYPVGHYISENLSIYFQAQYVNALAESLLNYQERTEAFRLGFSFIR